MKKTKKTAKKKTAKRKITKTSKWQSEPASTVSGTIEYQLPVVSAMETEAKRLSKAGLTTREVAAALGCTTVEASRYIKKH